MSPSVWKGAVYAHHGMPSFVSAGSHVGPKFCSAVAPVAGLRSTGSTLAWRTVGSHLSDARRAALEIVMGGPARPSGA
jgi:hypothetical protein